MIERVTPTHEVLREIERELAMRKKLYPGFIKDRRRHWFTRDLANHRYQHLSWGRKLIEHCLFNDPETSEYAHPVTLQEIIAEFDRELKHRQKAYPKMIQNGQLNIHRAKRQFKALQKGLVILEAISRGKHESPKLGKQQNLF